MTSNRSRSAPRQHLRHLCSALETPVRRDGERGLEAREARRGQPARIEPRRAVCRYEGPVRLERLLRETTREADAESFRIAHMKRAERLRAAQPFLARHGVVVELTDVDGDRTDRLRAVHEDRQAALAFELVHRHHLPGRPENVREREQLASAA